MIQDLVIVAASIPIIVVVVGFFWEGDRKRRMDIQGRRWQQKKLENS